MKKLIIGALIIFAHGIALSNNSNALQKLQTNFNSFKGMGIRATNFDYMNYSVTKVDLLSSKNLDKKTFESIDGQEKTYISEMQKKVDKFTPNSYRLHKLRSIGLWAAATAGCLYGGSQLSDNNSWGSYSLWGLGALFGLKTFQKTSKCWNPKNRVDKLKANWSNSLQIHNTLLQYQPNSNVINVDDVLYQDCKNIVDYQKAANQGNAIAQNALGYMYYQGRGVIKNHKEAISLFMKAASQGNVKAQYTLGCMCLDGLDVEKNCALAIKLFTKAADQNFAPAQNALGNMYFKGIGVSKKDHTKAKEYFEKAAKQGHKLAQKKLEELEEK